MKPIRNSIPYKSRKHYVPVKWKFWASHFCALLWMCVSILLAMPWLKDLAAVVSLPIAVLIITGISFIPGYLNAFLLTSLLLDRQPKMKSESPTEPVTILIAAHNEEDRIFQTLEYISLQDYEGEIEVYVIDNASTDGTWTESLRAQQELNLTVHQLAEEKAGKFHALNHGLQHVKTPYVITVDADTLLHPSSVRYLVARMLSCPPDAAAVAGSVLAKNSRENLWTKIQEWDYFLGIASIKRLQGLYQGTLVAQGAYSLYKTAAVKEAGGWPDAIGEDIVLTWRMLENNWKVFYEPLAVSFTEVPSNFKHFVRQRARWARGMIEGLREIKPWKQPLLYVKYLTSINMLMPYLDTVYTFAWIPGLILAFFGHYWIVGPMTLFVLPLTLVSYSVLLIYQKYFVFRHLLLNIRKNTMGFILFVIGYQMIMSPVSVYGYIQELFRWRRNWK